MDDGIHHHTMGNVKFYRGIQILVIGTCLLRPLAYLCQIREKKARGLMKIAHVTIEEARYYIDQAGGDSDKAVGDMKEDKRWELEQGKASTSAAAGWTFGLKV
eukprot:scaffold57701_cov50-Prasinocladus_malaysianus.AAC.1